MTQTNVENLLNYALKNGIIDLSALNYQCEEMKGQQFLKNHEFKIWQGKNGSWYTHLPDNEKGRKKVKRTTKESIEQAIIEFYKENPKVLNTDITLRELYKEWIVYKETITKSSASISRLEVDWIKYYLGESKELIDKPIKSLTKIELDTWIHTLIKKHQMNAKKYYNVSLIIRQCFEYAIDCSYLEKDFLKEIKVQTELFSAKKSQRAKRKYINQEKWHCSWRICIADFKKDLMIRRHWL
ncbi:MAG: hypothetical protein R3Y54_09475 [Eubacteriales bacterium]